MKQTIKKVLSVILGHPSLLPYLEKIVDLSKNDNNADISKNGELWLIETYSKNWSTVVDAGANHGIWSKLVCQKNSLTEVHSFEPVKKTYTYLENTKKDCPKMNIYNVALGASKHTTEISIFSGDHGLSSISRGNDKNGLMKTGTETIEVQTLSSFAEEKNISTIDMLKIDVEGYELEVLKGAESLLVSGRIKMIQFEYGMTYVDARIYLRDIFTYFSNKPYKIFKLMPNSLTPIKEYTQDLETLKCCNYVCIYDERK
jgi:FkbM family methyltransferase